ncbi:MAG: S24 family peptidase, partial [Bacteroidaceae bacterium]|nr:S24 family peptidase [Bacteroidaceae bacterium]
MTKEEWKRIFEALDKAGCEPMLCDTPVECFENEVPCGPFRNLGDPVSHIEMMPAEVLKSMSVCMAKVTGDSMKDVDILPDDLVKLEVDASFQDGDIVVVMRDGEMTLKAFCKDEEGRTWLVPQNKDYEAILVDGTEGIWPIGRVTEIVKKAPRVSYSSCLKRIREAKEKAEGPQVTLEEAMTKAVEKTMARGLWATDTCWSVVYTICQRKGYKGGYSDFVRDVESWPFSQPVEWKCTVDSVSRPLRNPKMLAPIHEWEENGVKKAFCLLAETLLEE